MTDKERLQDAIAHAERQLAIVRENLVMIRRLLWR